ncbi:MAG: hypothetical protein PHF79_02145 [Candidatus Pacebacteria bacterium]|nr:hypothetical protein [Candidatus Paceibacterota bacterium]
MGELEVPFLINPQKNKITEDVHVLLGCKTLKEAIKLKRAGKIKKLIAGPSICLSPEECGGIFYSKEIDKIVFPSSWPKDYFVSIDPYFKDKIEIWPSGVKIPKTEGLKTKTERKIDFLIFNKLKDPLVTGRIINSISKKTKHYKIIDYGDFNQEEYVDLLKDTKTLVYVGKSESQGLALQEAWAYNVPTLVYNFGYWKYGGYYWKSSDINAPYLSEKSGLLFKTNSELEHIIEGIDSEKINFLPHLYCSENLSDRKSAEIFLKIIRSI